LKALGSWGTIFEASARFLEDGGGLEGSMLLELWCFYFAAVLGGRIRSLAFFFLRFSRLKHQVTHENGILCSQQTQQIVLKRFC
jgi:hypothetical protein